jgi:hypothetical protein
MGEPNIGTKAAGLAMVAHHWTPEFIVLPTTAYNQWSNRGQGAIEEACESPVLKGFLGANRRSSSVAAC